MRRKTITNRYTQLWEATKIMSQRSGHERTLEREQDQLATICVARLPDKIKRAIHAYESSQEGLTATQLFVRIVFKNGHAVDFRHDWKEFVAQCILVYDLPPVETDDG